MNATKPTIARPTREEVHAMKELVLARDGHDVPCIWCRKPFDKVGGALDFWGATLEHIKPLSLGGLHVLENCAFAHRRCNHERGNRAHQQS